MVWFLIKWKLKYCIVRQDKKPPQTHFLDSQQKQRNISFSEMQTEYVCGTCGSVYVNSHLCSIQKLTVKNLRSSTFHQSGPGNKYYLTPNLSTREGFSDMDICKQEVYWEVRWDQLCGEIKEVGMTRRRCRCHCSSRSLNLSGPSSCLTEKQRLGLLLCHQPLIGCPQEGSTQLGPGLFRQFFQKGLT